jgi:hypothetical protein
MQTLIFAVAIVLITANTCSKEENEIGNVTGDNFCRTDNPLEDLPWLKQLKQSFEMSAKPAGAQIIGYKYQSGDAFLINGCVGCADEMWQVYDCSGKVICRFGGIAGLNTCPGFFETATDSTMLYNGVQQ